MRTSLRLHERRPNPRRYCADTRANGHIHSPACLDVRQSGPNRFRSSEIPCQYPANPVRTRADPDRTRADTSPIVRNTPPIVADTFYYYVTINTSTNTLQYYSHFSPHVSRRLISAIAFAYRTIVRPAEHDHDRLHHHHRGKPGGSLHDRPFGGLGAGRWRVFRAGGCEGVGGAGRQGRGEGGRGDGRRGRRRGRSKI